MQQSESVKGEASKFTVETYRLTASNGHPIRLATKITRNSDGKVFHFMERMTRKAAIKQFKMQEVVGL